MSDGGSTKLHLGCGQTLPEGWINVDGSWNVRFAKWPLVTPLLKAMGVVSQDDLDRYKGKGVVYFDVRRPLRWGTGSMDAVYHSHLLEHLYRDAGQRLLVECCRVLRPGGVCRVVVPDLEHIMRRYLEEHPGEDAADAANKGLMMRSRTSPRRGLRGLYNAFTEFHTHKFMYDGPALCKYMREAGFEQVEVRGAFESRLGDIESIEQAHRAGEEGLCVEGVKPA